MLHQKASPSHTGLFYPLVASDEEVRARLQDTLKRHFWSGEIDSRNFGLFLYRLIPAEESLKLRSFSYASPGAMEITGVLTALLLLSKVAQSWVKTGERFLSLWERVEKYFMKRRGMKRPPRSIELNEEAALTIEEARVLVLAVGDGLGFDALSCERLIDVVGNPVSALKYLVAAGKEGRKLAQLGNEGKLELPVHPGGSATILTSTGSRSKRVTNDAVRSGIKPRRRTTRGPSSDT